MEARSVWERWRDDRTVTGGGKRRRVPLPWLYAVRGRLQDGSATVEDTFVDVCQRRAAGQQHGLCELGLDAFKIEHFNFEMLCIHKK